MADNDVSEHKVTGDCKTERLRKIGAAFTNTRDTYIIFGVANNFDIVGVDNHEQPRDFGTTLRQAVEPSIDFLFSAPIKLANGKRVWVAHIPRSLRGPHSVRTEQSLKFYKRSPGGLNEPMTYEEIRLAFQNSEARRTKLRMLIMELQLIREFAHDIEQSKQHTRDNEIDTTGFTTQYPTTLLEALLAETLPSDPQQMLAWTRMVLMRKSMVRANGCSDQLGRFVAGPSSVVQGRLLQNHIRRLATSVREDVDEILPVIGAMAKGEPLTVSSENPA